MNFGTDLNYNIERTGKDGHPSDKKIKIINQQKLFQLGFLFNTEIKIRAHKLLPQELNAVKSRQKVPNG